MGKTIEELLREIPDFDVIEHEDEEGSWFEKKLEEMEEGEQKETAKKMLAYRNEVYAAILTNQQNFGVVSLFVPSGSDSDVILEGGMNFIEGSEQDDEV